MERINPHVPSLAWLGSLVALLAVLAASARAVNYDDRYPPEPAMSSYLRGQAEMVRAQAAMLQARAARIRAQAEANLAAAKTIHTRQQTASMALDNDLKAASIYFERKAMHDAYHSLKKPRERGKPEDYVRYSQMETPERPANDELEPLRGTIQWPELLQQEEFVEERIELDSLFAHRSRSNQTDTTEFYPQVQDAVQRLRGELKDKIDEISAGEYMQARRFIDSLSYEARFPPRPQGVASR